MGLLEKLEVNHAPGLTYQQMFLSVSAALHPSQPHLSIVTLQNEDLVPVPPKKRTWKARNFVSLYVQYRYLISAKLTSEQLDR